MGFLFMGTGQLVSPNVALFSLTALKLQSQVCGLPQANLEALRALLNSSPVSFFLISPIIYLFFYFNLSKYIKPALNSFLEDDVINKED